MFKKSTKFFIGIALLVQSISAVAMFFIHLGRKKSVSGAWLSLAVLTGAAGGYLVYDAKKQHEEDLLDDDFDDDYEEYVGDNDEIDIDEKNLFSRDDEAEAE